MIRTRFVSVAVLASFLVTALPGITWAEEPKPATTESAADLRSSIDRAAKDGSARLSITRPSSKAATSMSQNTGGGGGGHAMMIVSLVTAAAGIAGTYYMVKQIQKTTATLPTAGQ
jgi:hypothetical protein